ncbi:MAG: hypothetical protein EXX96DRAFT_239634 [Benjaminiella poitrasii]|nr:MAG: hypothetical protein EXX96DRAFT_239634 [Benjaminiella poitrasii]
MISILYRFFPDYSYNGTKAKAGHNGFVKWQFESDNNLLNDYNFAYSNIGKLEERIHMNRKLVNFFNDKESFMAFFLGWFMTEGTIKWEHGDIIGDKNTRILVYYGAEVTSPRDQYLLHLFTKRMRDDLGIHVELHKNLSKSDQAVLKILNSPETNSFLLEAIKSFKTQNIPLNGKILWWEELLYSSKYYVSDRTAPPLRFTFFEYLKSQTVLLSDHFTLLIGQ